MDLLSRRQQGESRSSKLLKKADRDLDSRMFYRNSRRLDLPETDELE